MFKLIEMLLTINDNDSYFYILLAFFVPILNLPQNVIHQNTQKITIVKNESTKMNEFKFEDDKYYTIFNRINLASIMPRYFSFANFEEFLQVSL